MLLISEMLQEYYDFKVLRNSTRQAYKVATDALIRRFGNCLVEELDTKSILKWRSEVLNVTLKPVSWNTYVRQLMILYKFALDQNLIGRLDNPFEACQVRSTKRVDKTVSMKDLQRARDRLDLMEEQEISQQQTSQLHPAWFWRVVFETLAYTGMRANELICLRMVDIDLAEGTIRVVPGVSKNHEERKIPIHHKLHKYIEQLLLRAKSKKTLPTQQLFNLNRFSMRHRKRAMDMDQLSAFFKQLSKQLGVRISPHRLRHTLATELMRENERNIHVVKDILGHQHIATTLKYITVNTKQSRDLINTMP